MSKDLELLQGAWTITALEMDGQEMPATMLANARIVITGERFESTGMGAEYAGALVLDASKRPGRLDMKFDSGPEKGNANLCIYELAGDTLKLCIATRGKVRPKKFASPAGSGFAFETLTRGDGRKRAKPAPAKRAAAPPAASGPETELEGEWQMLSGFMGGQKLDAATVKFVKRVTRGRRTTVYAGSSVMMEFEFTNDPNKSPRTLDYTHIAGVNKGKKQLGIYEVKGGRVSILAAGPGEPRPASLDAKPGKTGSLTVWTRAK